MTQEQINNLRTQLKDKVINFAQYRELLRDEARMLGHKVGPNDIIKLLEANALDDNRVVGESGSGKVWREKGGEQPEPEGAGGGESEDEGGKDKTDTGDGGSGGEEKPKKEQGKFKFDDESTPDERDNKAKELRRKMEDANKASAEAKRKAEEAEKVRKELEELNRKLAEKERRKKEEEERKRREENSNLKHYKTDELIDTLKTLGVAYLVGPAGTGKSTLAMDACASMFECKKGDDKFNLHFAQISFSPDTTSGEMVGRCDINGVFHESETVRVYRDGGLILFDEIDNADASMLVKLNTALANGTFATPAGIIRRNPNTYIVCTANTYGTGPDAMYVGRTRLDAATLDRYCMATVEVDYDEKLEGKLMSCLKDADRTWLVNFVKAVRKTINEKHFRRLCSTRFVINAVKWFMQGKDVCWIKNKFLLGWSDNERVAVGA